MRSIGKEELIKKFEPMLTELRTVLLEDRDLIDSNCRHSIQAKLRLGQRAGAATELVEYFEDNHDGHKMMEFCAFLEDQAGNTAPLLKQLTKRIRECVKTLSGMCICVCVCNVNIMCLRVHTYIRSSIECPYTLLISASSSHAGTS